MKYIKTETGQAAFKARSPLFSARQRSTFILFDGNKDAEQVLVSTAGMGVTMADVEYMLAQGFIEPVAGSVVAVVATAAVADSSQWTSTEGAIEARSDRTEQERYKDAKPLATQLTATLGLRGFMLNMAVESAGGYQELLVLLPKIQDAVGTKACRELERALKG
jgi:hypothetical protein